jgi:enoyl-CoA hydratase/carnithine racemase
MATMRVIQAPAPNAIAESLIEEQIVRRVRRALADPDVTTVIVHKAGSRFSCDGRDYVVDATGRMRELAAAAEGITSC